MTFRDQEDGAWLDDGRGQTIRILLEIPARQDVEFRTLDIVMALGAALDKQFGEDLQYKFEVED